MNRDEWLMWRKEGIGSSDVAVIMGTSRFKTPYELWEEKTSKEIKEDDSNQFIKDMGNQAEGKIRSFFEMDLNRSFDTALCVLEGAPFMRVSLDGRSENKQEIIEIKLLGDAKPDHKWSNAKNKLIVPPEYYPQIQMQLLVSKAKVCYFLAYKFDVEDRFLKNPITRDKLAQVTVDSDPVYQADLLKKCAEFWEMIKKKKAPPFCDQDWKKLKGAAKAIEKFKKLKKKFDEAEADLEGARNEIISLAESAKHPRLTAPGLTIQKIPRVGNVKYADIPQLKDVDLEKYRGPGTSYWKIS